MLAVVEHNQARPRMLAAEDAVIFECARLLPPRFAIAVDYALTRDRYVFRIDCAHQSLESRSAEFGYLRVICMIGRAKQNSPLVEIESYIALQCDRRAEIRSGTQVHSPAVLRTGIDRALNSGRVLRFPITFGSIRARVARLQCEQGWQDKEKCRDSGNQPFHRSAWRHDGMHQSEIVRGMRSDQQERSYITSPSRSLEFRTALNLGCIA
jgi:hypothetical protein